ncbi:hypothetical protein ABZ614_09065 [Streptomyces sp. NPDC013178]|uniref:hypothetical protein n=1 Tax=unclassified Streptomyces TaxID=2593676 RepID=UPI0033F22DDA
MGWGSVRRKAGLGRADADVTAAVAAGAAQLPAVFALWWTHALATDPYGSGYGSALGLACLFLFAPVYLPVLGLLHAWAQTFPGAALAEVVLRGVRRPLWVKHLLGVTLAGVVWAAVGAVLWDWSFTAAALVLAALGVLPVLATAYVRARSTRRAWGLWSVWWRAGVASVALFVLALPGGLLAVATGLIEEYEAPKLSAADVTGVWRGEEGEVLRLLPGGRAELTRMPAEPGFEATADFEVCDGTGTWSLDEESDYHARDDVVVRLDTGGGTGSGCGNDTSWTVAGTDRAPELFVIFGDPDAGELRILRPGS